jgi:molybdopterin converting factor subunit 1
MFKIHDIQKLILVQKQYVCSMEVKILFFGITKDFAKTKEIDLFINNDIITLKEIKTILQKKYPNLKDLDIYAFAINEEYANDNDKIINNDVIAVIPPVSGG